MKNSKFQFFYLFVLVVMLIPKANAQTQPFSICGQHELQSAWFKNNPETETQFFKNYEAFLKNNEIQQRGDETYTIPVVFHILHQAGPENISDERILSQINQLNLDFQNLNADTNRVVEAFKELIGDVKIKFQLAAIDPNGKCTNGILRHFTPNTEWNATNFDNYAYSWPASKYMNIYVVKTISGISAAAYTYLPGSGIPEKVDAIVSEYTYVGSSNLSQNRIMTHEVGHWLGLPHIWGFSNSAGASCGDDFVEDTPMTKGFSGCPSVSTAICNPPIQENFQNHMDYSGCSRMFTKGQVNLMRKIISNGISKRDVVVSKGNLLDTGIEKGQSCGLKIDVFSLFDNVCAGGEISFENKSFGGNASINFEWKTDALITSDTMPTKIKVKFPKEGLYNITLIGKSENQIDSFSKTIYAWEVNNELRPNLFYDFEDGKVPPIFNQTTEKLDDVSWKVSNTVGAKNSSSSISFNGFNKPRDSKITKYLETRCFDFSKSASPLFSFEYAAAKHSEDLSSFRIEYSLDCGGKWLNLPSVPSLSLMALKTGGDTNEDYKPTSEQWAQLTLSNIFTLLFKNKKGVRFRFVFTSASPANNLYIDNIRIYDESLSSLPVINEEKLKFFPNPASNEIFIAHLDRFNARKISLYDAKGLKVFHQDLPIGANTEEYRLEIPSGVRSGLYFIEIADNAGQSFRKKLMISK